MPRVRELIQDQGATLSNAFVSTPVCCPSRTTILSGRYPHNTFQGVGGCMHMNVTSSQFRDTTVSVWLQKLGYNVGLFGKYLNSHNVFCGDNAKPLPPGWDRFFALCSDAYFGTEYNDQGTLKKVGFKPSDYQTSVIGNSTAAVAWSVHLCTRATLTCRLTVAPLLCHQQALLGFLSSSRLTRGQCLPTLHPTRPTSLMACTPTSPRKHLGMPTPLPTAPRHEHPTMTTMVCNSARKRERVCGFVF